AKTDAQGTFALSAPGTGVYWVRVTAPGSLPQTFLAAAVEAMELPPLGLRPDAGLAVRVTDAAGKPVAGARVRLAESFSLAAAARWRGGPWGVAPRLATTGADGRVTLPRAADEEVKVQVQAPGQAAVEVTSRAGQGAAEVRLAGGCPRALEVRDGAGK